MVLVASVDSPRVVSMFTGIGGLDLGLSRAGATTVAMCESWEPARRVLEHRFPGIDIARRVESLVPDHDYEILAAGFPCTDLSHAGGKAGIFGAQSGLVEHVFRIAARTNPEWIVLENVPNLLRLHRGLGIRTVTDRLASLGYRWAYRMIDSRFTGVPQRRHRVILLASRRHAPAPRLLTGARSPDHGDAGNVERVWGFYWTEGRTGLGLVRGAVPTLKGGSTIGLPSAPAVWLPEADLGRKILLPSLAAAELMQGLDPGWTDAAKMAGERDPRWKLVGNAVTTGVGEWIGRQIINEQAARLPPPAGEPVDTERPWPDAAYGGPGTMTIAVTADRWPDSLPPTPLTDLVDEGWAPLSHRATKGFLSRVDESGRTLPQDFAADLEEHLESTPRRLRAQPSIEDVIAAAMNAHGFHAQRDVRLEAGIPHRLDIVISDCKFAVDVRACFWHGCPRHGPETLRSNPRWRAKRDRVMQRDRDMEALALEAGWTIYVVWNHDDPRDASATALETLRQRRSTNGSTQGRILGHLEATTEPDGHATRSQTTEPALSALN